MGKYYDNFNQKNVNGQSLIHLINLHLKSDLVGVEVGVYKALTFCTFLQMCPNIKTLHGVDNYKPSKFNTAEDYVVDEKESEFIKLVAFHNIQYSGHAEKVVFHQQDSLEAAKSFDDNSLDFVFLDAAVINADLKKDIEAWYPKVKEGGLFSGHDWDSLAKPVVELFRKTSKVTSPISVFDNVWVWVK